ncbi:hypothetical protein OHC33_011257 [Knufia fluminis]|uniref:Fungal N-terminal domain-containing protein n=1 Tax=Knufia fluminis TaxID=191047 RepID=A0AAN8ED91_9EURO|nr:hypothetical protein OHC33_011257 [Knufia fluminis]
MEALGAAGALLSIADVVRKAISGMRRVLKKVKSAHEDMAEFIKSVGLFAAVLSAASNTVEQMQKLQLKALKGPDILTLTRHIVDASSQQQKIILEATRRVKSILHQCSSASLYTRYCKGKLTWLRYEHTVIKKTMVKLQPVQGCVSMFSLVLSLRLALGAARNSERQYAHPSAFNGENKLVRGVKFTRKEIREANKKYERLESMVTTRDAHFDQILENMNKSVHKVLSNTNQLRADLGIRKSSSKGDSLCGLLSTTRQATSSRSRDDTQLSSCTPSLSSSPQIRPSIVHTLQTSESPSVIWVSSEDQRGQIYAPAPFTSDIIATPDDFGPETDVESDASWPCSLVSGPMMVFTEAG